MKRLFSTRSSATSANSYASYWIFDAIQIFASGVQEDLSMTCSRIQGRECLKNYRLLY